jgi:hypothetical protein
MPLEQQESAMIVNNNAVIVSYPNQAGDPGRYDLRDQRAYFTQFDGGSSYVFELALENALSGDLLDFNEACNTYFDNQCILLFADNSITLDDYHKLRKEFNRRIFDIYRYAKTSLARLGDEPGFSKVVKLSANPKFDSGSFLLK